MESSSAATLAPIDKGAIPDLKYIREMYEPFYGLLKKAVYHVRSSASCKKVLWADFSVSETQGGKPVVYVRYETNRAADDQGTLTQYFPIVDLENT
ncbi:hypothetical protein SAMN02745866_01459 [Alteromonadaceae bacterium Bs31]|nr:hypothetical protein SAMN02745866_01459 [Alteromonadaceae bacterium Bs31]